jgi:hypothetical protein
VEDPVVAERPLSDAGDAQSTSQLPRVAPGHNAFDQKELMQESDSVERLQPASTQTLSVAGEVKAGLAAPAPPLPPQPEDLVTSGDDGDLQAQPPSLSNERVHDDRPFSTSISSSASHSTYDEGNGAMEGDLQHVQDQLFKE